MFDANHILVMNLQEGEKKLSYVYVNDFFSEQGASCVWVGTLLNAGSHDIMHPLTLMGFDEKTRK